MTQVIPMMVSDDIEEKIKKGVLLEGTQLPSERRLAELYDIGRNSVREAMKILKEKGLVEIVTGKGVYIKKPAPNELMDKFESAVDQSAVNPSELIEVRNTMEVAVGKVVMQRITTDQLKRLQEIYDKMELAKYDSEEYLQLDAHFHIYIAGCTNNSAFVILSKAINNLTDRKFLIEKKNIHVREGAQREHFAMLQAIRNRDIINYEQAVGRHMDCIRKLSIPLNKEEYSQREKRS